MSPLRVLFVDDQQAVLDGLRRMLRDMRTEWDMAFINEPRAAIAALAETGFHVIVSDMRMPGIDGAELMSRARVLCPGSVRIILSGDADDDAATRAANVAHQFLAKPCDSTHLRAVISRVAGSGRFARHDAVQAFINGLDALPKPPAPYTGLIDVLRGPRPSTTAVVATLTSDPGLVAEILALANLAFFRTASPIDRIDRAVQMIGIGRVGELVAASSIKQAFRNPGVPPDALDEFWRHSTRAARFAGVIGRAAGVPAPATDLAVTGALLHDIGRLVLLTVDWEAYREVLAAVERGERRSIVERRVFGVNHVEVGGYVLGLWNLPDRVVEMAAHHDDLAAAVGSDPRALALVHLADLFAREFGGGGPAEGSADVAFLEGAGFDLDWADWRSGCAKMVGGMPT